MLSPGESWKSVPKDRVGNVEFRRYLVKRGQANHRVRQALLETCGHDLLFYVNAFVVQFNPAKMGDEAGPFITWPFQDKALTYGERGKSWGLLGCVEDQVDLVVEKSREMGASWMFLIVADWMAKFHRNKQFLLISRSEKAVESESQDSLLWKVDYMNRYLPEWLRGPMTRRKMYIGYDRTGSAITGEASTGRAGVGGRATAAFIDEFAQIKEDFEVRQRTSDTTRCRIFNSTHLGTDTSFWEMCQQPDMRKLVLHWTQHPDKIHGLYRYSNALKRVEPIDKTYHFPADFHFILDGSPTGGPRPGVRSPWYDEQCKRKGSSRAVAMDLDINPQGSVSQFFDPLLIRSLQESYCVDPYWEGDIRYERDSGRPIGLVAGKGGLLKFWMHIGSSGEVPPGHFAVGADLATGTGATNSCISAVNVKTGEKVMEYANPAIAPADLAPLAVALCRMLFNALFAWESAGPGLVFGNKIIELGYYNVYYRESDFSINPEKSKVPGWYPAPAAKRLLMEEYRAALTSRQLCNRSQWAMEECLKFRYSTQGKVEHDQESGGNDPSGARENHGDRVIADALAWKMAKSLGAGEHRKKKSTEVAAPLLSLQWRRDLAERQEEEAEYY